jgi:predicted nucleotidyltransferase component of viral defense system
LNKLKQETNVELSVYERDYLLSFVLAAISQVPALSETIVFKGGTALRKCYFPGYRFSEDLNFSALDSFNVAEIEQQMSAVCKLAAEMLNVYEPYQVAMGKKTGSEAIC